MNSVPSIHSVSSWEDKIVVIRAGLNVPLDEEGAIADDFRLTRILPTLMYIQDAGAKIVIVGHIGRDKHDNLATVASYLQTSITDLRFKEDFFGESVSEHITELTQEIEEAPGGSVWLLDNIRATQKEYDNDTQLAHQLAQLADIYINEAFSASHRLHMSLDALPRACTKAYAGYSCLQEVEELSMALHPQQGSLAIIGGNKFATKLPLIEKFLDEYNKVVIGGALANTLYHLQGYEIGASLYEQELSPEVREKLLGLLDHQALYLPALVVCETAEEKKAVKHITEVGALDTIFDIAPESLWELDELIQKAPTITWNGPLGYTEGGYIEGSKYIVERIVQSQAQSIVGGGNTVDLVRDLGYGEELSFLSTGGGAMIQFLVNDTLPALEALHE